MNEHDPADHDRDPEIHDAYGRLDGSLTPPPDIAVRVDRRVRTRRHRRRALVVGTAGLLVVGAVGGAALLGGGDGDGSPAVASDTSTEATPTPTPTPTPAPLPGLQLVRADGSTYEFTGLSVKCAPSQDGKGGQEISISSEPRDFDPDTGEVGTPWLTFNGTPSKIDGQTFDLEQSQLENEKFVLFALETTAQSDGDRANEVSSSEGGAAGTVHVVHASCDPVPVLELEVDATLGSEVQQGTLDVVGTVRVGGEG